MKTLKELNVPQAIALFVMFVLVSGLIIFGFKALVERDSSTAAAVMTFRTATSNCIPSSIEIHKTFDKDKVEFSLLCDRHEN